MTALHASPVLLCLNCFWVFVDTAGRAATLHQCSSSRYASDVASCGGAKCRLSSRGAPKVLACLSQSHVTDVLRELRACQVTQRSSPGLFAASGGQLQLPWQLALRALRKLSSLLRSPLCSFWPPRHSPPLKLGRTRWSPCPHCPVSSFVHTMWSPCPLCCFKFRPPQVSLDAFVVYPWLYQASALALVSYPMVCEILSASLALMCLQACQQWSLPYRCWVPSVQKAPGASAPLTAQGVLPTAPQAPEPAQAPAPSQHSLAQQPPEPPQALSQAPGMEGAARQPPQLPRALDSAAMSQLLASYHTGQTSTAGRPVLAMGPPLNTLASDALPLLGAGLQGLLPHQPSIARCLDRLI